MPVFHVSSDFSIEKTANVLPRALLTSVNQKDPDGAYELLQSAKLIEQRHQGPNQEIFYSGV